MPPVLLTNFPLPGETSFQCAIFASPNCPPIPDLLTCLPEAAPALALSNTAPYVLTKPSTLLPIISQISQYDRLQTSRARNAMSTVGYTPITIILGCYIVSCLLEKIVRRSCPRMARLENLFVRSWTGQERPDKRREARKLNMCCRQVRDVPRPPRNDQRESTRICPLGIQPGNGDDIAYLHQHWLKWSLLDDLSSTVALIARKLSRLKPSSKSKLNASSPRLVALLMIFGSRQVAGDCTDATCSQTPSATTFIYTIVESNTPESTSSSSPSTSQSDPSTTRSSNSKWFALLAFGIVLILGICYRVVVARAKRAQESSPKKVSPPAKWWNRLPLPKLGTSELSSGQAQYDRAELGGSVPSATYELSAESTHRGVYHSQASKLDVLVNETAEMSGGSGQEDGSPRRIELYNSPVVHEASDSPPGQNTDTDLEAPTRLPPVPPISEGLELFPTPDENTPMLSQIPSGDPVDVLGSIKLASENDLAATAKLPVTGSPSEPFLHVPYAAANVPQSTTTLDPRNTTPGEETPISKSSAILSTSHPEFRPPLPPRPVKKNKLSAAVKKSLAPWTTQKLSPRTRSLTQSTSQAVPQSPLMHSTTATKIPLSSQGHLDNPTSSRTVPLAVQPGSGPAVSVGEQDLAGLYGAFAPLPLPPPPPLTQNSSATNPVRTWVYR